MVPHTEVLTPLDIESADSSHRRHLQVYIVTDTEGQISPFAISIALLSALCNPQIFSHSLHHLLCIIYDLRAKELLLTNLIPIERSPAFSAIQCLKGGLLQTGLIAVVV